MSVTIPVILYTPDLMVTRDKKTRERTPDEIAYARDLTTRFAGLMNWASDGYVRLAVYSADPTIPYDVSKEQFDPTGEGGGAVHSGAANTYRSQFKGQEFGFEIFIGCRSFLNPNAGEFGFSWPGGTWTYVHAVPGILYANSTQYRPHDVLIHEFAHLMQTVIPTALDPDVAGEYGFRENAAGWMDFLRAILTGIPAVHGGMFPDLWNKVPRKKPTSIPPTVSLLPSKSVDPWTPYKASDGTRTISIDPVPSTTSPTRSPRART